VEASDCHIGFWQVAGGTAGGDRHRPVWAADDGDDEDFGRIMAATLHHAANPNDQ
jgi:hypothetical protein